MNSNDFFASCPKGLENLLLQELQSLGATAAQETVSGVKFQGDMALAYRCCLWSRLANHVFLLLNTHTCETKDQLYQMVYDFQWNDHIMEDNRLRIDFHGSVSGINNTQFATYLIKDAIVDKIKSQNAWRPNIDPTQPDIRIYIHVHKKKASIYLNLSGHSLHQRGYRTQGGIAPLKENLAAAILMRAKWAEKAQEQHTLLDPMCGSGTFLIEGAMMIADIAPGLSRAKFGFSRWLGHIPKIWENQLNEAKERKQIGLNKNLPKIIGFEGVNTVVKKAQKNIALIGLSHLISVEQQELQSFKLNNETPKGLIICNPPYGERLGEKNSLPYLYQHLGEKLKLQCAGWQAGIFTGNASLIKYLKMGYDKKYAFFNGSLPCHLYCYQIRETQPTIENEPDQLKQSKPCTEYNQNVTALVNRIKKNQRNLNKWHKKNNIECYRLYHADIPEYAIVIDQYKNWLHVQEYSAPKSISEEKAQERLYDAMSVLPDVLNIEKSKIILKTRQRQKGLSQYQKVNQVNQMLEVNEHGCRLLVNLHDYLDTGLFLDHRPMRLRIQEQADKKKFLNLFCYTASATIHAAVGGSPRSTSVDLSNTYLEWGRKNLALNGLSEARHQFVKSDCQTWLEQNTQLYDLIFMDPPTFSNSKKMQNAFNIQADHVKLIQLAMKSLEKNGTLYFSSNFKKFKLDSSLFNQFNIQDITHQTIDKDFINHKFTHFCWKITFIN